MKPERTVTFYVVAHQDDWQLFMTPNAHRDLNNRSNKVVFIYTTAGDAGKDRPYWEAREKGALQSVQFALNTSASPPQEVVWGQKSYRGHSLAYSEYKTTGNYFLRLPDGRMTGKGSEGCNHESLTKLHKGKIDSITAVDQSTTYQGWDDFCQTLAEIMRVEAEGSTQVWVNASDFLLTNNFIDNADHTASGVAAKAAIQLLGGKYPLTLYRDYDVDMLPPNLTPRQVLWKTSLFMAYDVTVQGGIDHCTHCESPYYMDWCLRQYRRHMHPNSAISLVGHAWAHTLRLVVRLRRGRGGETNALTTHGQ